MVLQANPKYWGTAHKPATQNVVIRFLTDDNAAVNALKSGDVDVLSPVNATLAKSLDASTYTVSAADGSDKFVLAFNCTNAKLKDSASVRPSATPSTTRRLSPPEATSTTRSAVRSRPSTPVTRT